MDKEYETSKDGDFIHNIDEYLKDVDHHPILSDVVDILCDRIQSADKPFIRNLTMYHLGVCAATMHAVVDSEGFGQFPVNIFNIALGGSGRGKGFCTRMLEDNLLKGFRDRFVNITEPQLAEFNIQRRAAHRAINKATNDDQEIALLAKQFAATGSYAFSFDNSSEPAIKQLRQHIQISGCGSLNLIVDEFGMNLERSSEAMKVYLELYDHGQIKDKLTKHSGDNYRYDPLTDPTPGCAFFFGAPDMLFAGGHTEDNFYSFLRQGFARRTLFSIAQENDYQETRTISEIYDDMRKSVQETINTPLVDHFTQLADSSRINWTITMPDNVGKRVVAYRLNCQLRSSKMGHNQGDTIGMTEMEHRYSRVIKIAGIFAFIDGTANMTIDHVNSAIKLVEESGAALGKILNRPMAHQRLAHYIADSATPLTFAEMKEQLPYVPKSMPQIKELMTLAIAYGYKNNIVIQKAFDDSVEVYTGDSLKETDTDNLIVSYSNHLAHDYQTDVAPFDKLQLLATAPNIHFCNHRFKNQHRLKTNFIPGFNMIVLDVDGTVSIKAAQELMSEYIYFAYTTKSHTEESNRFRMILPTNFKLELERNEYVEFMNSVMAWLPFEVDKEGNQPERKWRSNEHAKIFVNSDAKLLDVLPFIPRTRRNETHIKTQSELNDLGNLERWIANQWSDGTRNKLMLRYTMCLVDEKRSLNEVSEATIAFNNSLPNPLSEDELRNTVLKTAAQRMCAA